MQEKIKEIRQRFYAMRNGILAEQLRNQPRHHNVIFGLNVPQIAEIARSLNPPDPGLADALWQHTDNREGRLLACYLFDPQSVSEAHAMKLLHDIITPEEADMLAFRIIKHLPFAETLAAQLDASDNLLHRYAAKAIRRHIE